MQAELAAGRAGVELSGLFQRFLGDPVLGDQEVTRRSAVTFTATMTCMRSNDRKESSMLWTLVVVLVVLWLLGLLTSYTLGGVIHILLVVALVLVAINVFQGRRTSA
jgi:hypothetical protein